MKKFLLLISLSLLITSCAFPDENGLTVYKIDNNIEYKYTRPSNLNEKGVPELPEGTFMIWNEEKNKWRCIYTGDRIKEVKLFKKETESEECSGFIGGCATVWWRKAYICDYKYVIEDYNDDMGSQLYGPFDLYE